MTAVVGFWVWGFGFWVLGFGFGFWVLGFGFWVLGFGVWGLGFGVWGLGRTECVCSSYGTPRFSNPTHNNGFMHNLTRTPPQLPVQLDADSQRARLPKSTREYSAGATALLQPAALDVAYCVPCGQTFS